LILFDLLVKHNCVIVPEFGGFVSKRVSSKIDFDKGIVIPPSKHILFNRHLSANDGLILAEYAERNQITYVEAEEKLVAIVAKLQQDLKQGKEVLFPRIGVLKRSSQGFFTFLQDKEFNLLSDAYGLTDLEFIVAKQESSEVLKQETPVVEMEPIVSKPNRLSRKKLLRYAAAACLLPLMFYTFWIPIKSDFLNSGLISIHDFDPFYSKESGSYCPKKDNLKSEIEAIHQTNVEMLPIEILTSEEKVEETNNPEKVIEASIKTAEKEKVETPYFKQYIVGCFAVKENAVNFKNKIESDGFTPIILKGGKLHRVSMGMTYSKEEFNQMLLNASSKGYNGWTLKQ
jgi:hypothetical protein